MEQKHYNEDEVDLFDYVDIIIKRKKLFFVVFFVFVLIATTIVFLTPNTYEAIALIRIGNASKPLLSKTIAQEEVRRTKLLSTVIEKLELSIDEFELKNTIQAEDVAGTDLIKIKVKNTNPQLATNICDSIADIFIRENNVIYTKDHALLTEKLNDLIKKGSTESEKYYWLKNQLIFSKAYEVFEPAHVPRQLVVSVKKYQIIFTFLILGLMTGIFAVVCQELLQKKHRKR